MGIYRLDPRGGLEDHCIRIGTALMRRGHSVTIHAAGPEGAGQIPVSQLDIGRPAATNHARMRQFAGAFAAASGSYDRSVAFQPAPGTDLLFCADLPRGGGRQGWWQRLLARSRTYARLEAGVFAPAARTRVILLTERQRDAYVARYDTPAERIALIPPSISRAKRQPQLRRDGTRERRRAELGVPPGIPLWLWVGLHATTKGLDRVMAALATEPEAMLVVCGLGSGSKAERALRAIHARRFESRVRLLGFVEPQTFLETYAAADVLVHPARLDVTGSVIVEALINGLPVVVTENCGFAYHVSASGAGRVIAASADTPAVLAAVRDCVGQRQEQLSALGVSYGETADLYDGVEAAADLIERWPGE